MSTSSPSEARTVPTRCRMYFSSGPTKPNSFSTCRTSLPPHFCTAPSVLSLTKARCSRLALARQDDLPVYLHHEDVASSVVEVRSHLWEQHIPPTVHQLEVHGVIRTQFQLSLANDLHQGRLLSWIFAPNSHLVSSPLLDTLRSKQAYRETQERGRRIVQCVLWKMPATMESHQSPTLHKYKALAAAGHTGQGLVQGLSRLPGRQCPPSCTALEKVHAGSKEHTPE